jgi:hypothetical protein
LKKFVKRKDLLTEEQLKKLYTELSGEVSEYRNSEAGWGADNYYPKLNKQNREALDEHELLRYPTISLSDKEIFLKWVEGHKFGAKISTMGQNLSKQQYIEMIQSKKAKRIAID